MKSKRRFPRVALVLLIVFLVVVAAGVVALGLVYMNLTRNLPDLEALRNYSPCLVTRVFDAEEELIGEFFIEKREVVPIERIPQVLANAMIAAEDAKFYSHEGLDFVGIFRAFVKNLRARGIRQGGSTITQQVVKSLLLTPERSYKRKIKEAILAYRLESALSKDEILELYLNQIYFGHGAYGVQVASRNYFGHNVDDVTLAEAALLAGLPQAPSSYSPARHPERARERQVYVLEQMLSEGMISEEEMTSALSEDVSVKPAEEVSPHIGPYFLDFVREHLLDTYGKDKTFCGGLKVYTTMKKEEQEAAEEAVAFGVEAYRKRQEEDDTEPDEVGKDAEEESNPVQAALVSMDLPAGAIRAMVGGVDYSESKFNRVLQAKRQPGSSIKPLIYAAALEKGYTPASIVVDSPLVFEDPALVGKWKPRNYSRRFIGPTTFREAFMNSRNVVTIKVLQDIGVRYATRYANNLGIESQLTPDLSFALGSSEVTLLELVTVYSAFAQLGERSVPMFIQRVVTQEGHVLEEYEPESKKVIRPEIAYLMTSLMQSVVQEGTGRSVKSLGIPCAGTP